MIVDNRPGATGNIATDYLAKAKPDGYTLYITSTSVVINQLVGAILKGLHDPKVWAARAQQGVEMKEGGPEETRKYLADELRKWDAIVKASSR